MVFAVKWLFDAGDFAASVVGAVRLVVFVCFVRWVVCRFDWLVDIVVLFSSVVMGLLFYVSWLVRCGECCVSLIAFCVVYGWCLLIVLVLLFTCITFACCFVWVLCL